MLEKSVFDGIPEVEANIEVKKQGTRVINFGYNPTSKIGHIELSDGRKLDFYNYDYRIKMTSDHNLNQIRLLLAKKNTKLNKNEYYSADWYRGKHEGYYTVTYHRNGKQKMICKGYSSYPVFSNLSQLEGFRDVNVANYPIIDSKIYQMYINYLKYKKRIDSIIKKRTPASVFDNIPEHETKASNKIPANIFDTIEQDEESIMPPQSKNDNQVKFESITKEMLRAITLAMINDVVYAYTGNGTEPMYNSFLKYLKSTNTVDIIYELDYNGFNLIDKISNMYNQVIKVLNKRGKTVYRVGAYNHDHNEGSVWTEYYTVDKEKGLKVVKEEIKDMIDLNRDDENAWYGQTFQEWDKAERDKIFCEVI